MSDLVESECRSCHAPIFWLQNTETLNRAPINAAAVPDGNCSVDAETGQYTLLPARERVGRSDLHKNHFATCPNAASHGRKAAK